MNEVQVALNQYLTVAILLFSIGMYGVLTRRNAVGILMSIELMFNAANIALVAFGRFLAPPATVAMGTAATGQMFALFVVAVAAAEITIGVAIVLSVYRNYRTINVEEVDLLKW